MTQMGLNVVFKMALKHAFPGCPNCEKPRGKRKRACSATQLMAYLSHFPIK